jgi:hypothetical protein
MLLKFLFSVFQSFENLIITLKLDCLRIRYSLSLTVPTYKCDKFCLHINEQLSPIFECHLHKSIIKHEYHPMRQFKPFFYEYTANRHFSLTFVL